MTNEDTSRIIELPVGDDIVLAQVLEASLAEEGIEAELVLSSDPYVGLEHTSPHRVMIRESDFDAAQPVIAAHVQAAASAQPAVGRRRPRGMRDLVALVLLAPVVGGLIIAIIGVVREILSLL